MKWVKHLLVTTIKIFYRGKPFVFVFTKIKMTACMNQVRRYYSFLKFFFFFKYGHSRPKADCWLFFLLLCVSFINRKTIYRMIVTVTCHIGYCLRLSQKTPSFLLLLLSFLLLWFCSLFVFLLYDPCFEKKKKDLRFTQTPISSSQNREEKCELFPFAIKIIFKSLQSCVAFVQNFKGAPTEVCDFSQGVWCIRKARKKHVCQTCSQGVSNMTSIHRCSRNLYISVDWLCDHMKDRWR